MPHPHLNHALLATMPASSSNAVFAGTWLVWLINALASVTRGTGNMLVSATRAGLRIDDFDAGHPSNAKCRSPNGQHGNEHGAEVAAALGQAVLVPRRTIAVAAAPHW